MAREYGPKQSSSSQIVSSGTAQQMVGERKTRVRVTFKNIGTSTDAVRVGAATVTATTGMQLLAGESVTFTAQHAWQVIATTGTPTVVWTDEYD